jgi:hypothetical protein
VQQEKKRKASLQKALKLPKNSPGIMFAPCKHPFSDTDYNENIKILHFISFSSLQQAAKRKSTFNIKSGNDSSAQD